jgi:hypothetical protein
VLIQEVGYLTFPSFSSQPRVLDRVGLKKCESIEMKIATEPLVDRFNVPKATIIRHLIAQAKPEDFPVVTHFEIWV